MGKNVTFVTILLESFTGKMAAEGFNGKPKPNAVHLSTCRGGVSPPWFKIDTGWAGKPRPNIRIDIANA